MNIIPKNTNILHKQSLKLSDDVVGQLAPKPTPLAYNFDAIPRDFKDLNQWVLWKYILKDGNWTKIPYQVTNRNADSTKKSTWCSYLEALKAFNTGKFDGIGFAIGDSGFTCVDIDHEDEWPKGELDKFKSGLNGKYYKELSPSGNGYHLWIKATKPKGMGCKSKSFHNSLVEVYNADRFITMTGLCDWEHCTIQEAQTELETVFAPLMPKPKPPQIPTLHQTPLNLDDKAIVDLIISSAARGTSGAITFCDLHNNGSPDGTDYSGNELAYFNSLAFYTGNNAAQMDRIYRSGAMMRDKWNREDYRQRTLDKAMAGCTTFYDSKHNQSVTFLSDVDFDDVSDTDNVIGQLESEVIHDDADLTGILGKDSPLGGYITALARETKMPVNTVFDTALSIISMVFTRSHTISYEGDTGILPIVLNLIAEQPPGTSKSRLLKALQSGVFNECKQERKRIIKELESLEKSDQTEETETAIHSLKRRRAGLFSFITDTTPEALDASLGDTNGCFALASAEQAVLNTLLGLSYGNGNAANIDLMLKGFNGEWHKSMRKSRDTFEGVVVGGFSCLAQVEVIVNALKKSGSTGLIERCMLRSEPSLIGQRDHLKKQLMDRETRTNFNSAISFLTELSFNHQTTEFEDLPTFRLTDKAWYKINVRRNELEKTIAGGGENSATLLQGAISKIDMFIVKIGAVLHGMDSLLRGNDFVPPIIEDKFIDQAIQIRDAQLAHMKGLIKNSSIVALSDRETKILDLVKSSSTGVITAKLARDKCYRASCFKHDGKYKRENVQKTIVQMQNDTLINVILKKGMNGEKDEIYLSLP